MFKMIGRCCKFTEVVLITLLVVSVKLTHSGFIENPVDVEEFIGFTALFECRYFGADGLVDVHATWIVNNSTLNRDPDPPCHRTATFAAARNSSNIIIVSTLTITAAKECNGTEVCCYVWLNASGMMIRQKSTRAVLYVRDIPRLDKAELKELPSGNIVISWDTVLFENDLRNVSVTYRVNITNDSNGSSVVQPVHSNSLARQSLFTSFNPELQNQSQCTTFSISIVPVINYDFTGQKTPLFQYISPITSVTYGYVTFVDGHLQFTYSLQMPLPFCNITINAINNIDNSTYCVDKMRTDIHSTESDSLVFAVADMELPFNELYTASISLSNYYSSETVQMPVALSTYDIQQVLRKESEIEVVFVRQTSAWGAFIVCKDINESNQFNYIVARKLRNDTIELGVLGLDQHVQSDCEILMYDIESNGLLKETATLRPALTVHDVCILGCELPISSANDSVRVTYEEGSIRFDCSNISDPNNELLGCIAILHNETDYMILRVQTINKNSTLNISAQAERNYSYVVFEWKRSGLHNSNELKKGILFANTERVDNVTSGTTFGSVPGDDLNTTVIMAIASTTSTAILVFIIIAAIVIIVLFVLKYRNRPAASGGQTVMVKPAKVHDPNTIELK